jgi:hypothetical protein
MQTKILFLFLVLILGKISLTGQNKLLPIDSLYISKIDEFYKNALEFKDKAWLGMELSPVCIFRKNGPAFLYNHPNPPENLKKIRDNLFQGTQVELQLIGATQSEINGTLTAIIDYGLPNYSCPDEVYAELFHEIHHVYQRNRISGINHDNPVTLMSYPENYKNDALKIVEQELIYNLCFCNDDKEFKQLLNQINCIREKRKAIIGVKYSDYEKDVESLEGPAFYCQLQYYQKYTDVSDNLKKNYSEKEFFGVLNTPYYGREKLRYRHLASGMAMCFILDKYKKNWKKEYYTSGMKLYDFFKSQFEVEKIDFDETEIEYAISKYHTQLIVENHIKNLDEFQNQKGVKVILTFNNSPKFRGFDPMHAEAINDSTVLHTTLLKLKGDDDNELFISNWQVITNFIEQIWFVDKIIVFVPEKDIQLTDNKLLEIKTKNISISWKGIIKSKNEDEIVFICN